MPQSLSGNYVSNDRVDYWENHQKKQNTNSKITFVLQCTFELSLPWTFELLCTSHPKRYHKVKRIQEAMTPATIISSLDRLRLIRSTTVLILGMFPMMLPTVDWTD